MTDGRIALRRHRSVPGRLTWGPFVVERIGDKGIDDPWTIFREGREIDGARRLTLAEIVDLITEWRREYL